MKSFFQFLTEATQSQASMQAKKLGLKGDGHGGWIDRAGKVVARTEKGKLKFTEKRTSKGQEEPKADTQKSAAPAPQTKNKSSTSTCTTIKAAPKPAPEDQSQETPPLTIVFGRFNPPTVGHDKLLKSAVENICWWRC
jgi:cell division septation protein DedD